MPYVPDSILDLF